MKTAVPQDDKDRLAAAVRKSGLKGLAAGEVERQFGLSPEKAAALSQELEAEGELLILSFTPLRLLSRSSLEHLKEKIKGALERHHRSRPSNLGLAEDKLRERFGAPRLVFSLALRSLTKDAAVAEDDGRLRLASFTPSLTPRQEHLVAQLEEECLKDGFGSVRLEDFRAEHRLAPGTLDKMMSILVSRQKIVRGRDGLYLHSRWLEEVVGKIRSLPGRELSVAEFKNITGLSRKYAIPLLELLDQMGVTRRKGSSREVLPERP